MQLTHHFTSAPLVIMEDESEHRLVISEWLPAGALLCSCAEESGPGTIILQPKEGTELTENGMALRSTTAGYPYLDIQQNGAASIVKGHVEPMLEINDDGWSASLTLYPSLPGSTVPDPNTIISHLHEYGVCFGIREKALQKAYSKVTQDQGMVHNLVIARGRLPVNGRHGKLRFAVELGAQPGKERVDGSMDFKERNLFVGVEEGQLLATTVAPTLGMAGMNIFGETIAQQPGRELPFNPDSDVLYDEQTGEIRAACAGVVALIGDNGVKVTNFQVIPSNVDYSTGNIRSKGSVAIKGNLLPGFSVAAAGNVHIDGEVAGGTIHCGANVTVKGGVTGKEAVIDAQGDVELSFIEEGKVISRGAVRVAKAIYFSEIHCDGPILTAADAKIVASTLIAGGAMQLGHVDTETSPSSTLAAACSPYRYERFIKLKDQVANDEKRIARLQALLGTDGRSAELDQLADLLKSERTLLKNFNLVPDGDESDRMAGLRYASRHTISVSGTLSADVIIRLGNSQTRVNRLFSTGGIINLDPDSQKLLFRSADGKQPPLAL